jgi:thymidine kinase
MAAGHLVVIVGPMFSGKSTELVGRLQRWHDQGARVQALRPVRDTRDGEAQVVTHDGVRWPATRASGAHAIMAGVVPGVTVLGIDEGNMFGPELFEVCLDLMRRSMRVLVSGLSLDYRGRPFSPMPALMSIASEVVIVASVCACCGEPARFSQRLVRGSALIMSGGAETYEPRCLECFDPAPETSEARVELARPAGA